MNNNFTAYEAERISEKYRTREVTALDELRALDTKVKRPANVFAYTFGAIGAIVMGAGMSLVMTDIGGMLGIESNMAVGIAVGVVGMVMSLVNYPIFKGILKSRKKKYSDKIIALSDQIINEQ